MKMQSLCSSLIKINQVGYFSVLERYAMYDVWYERKNWIVWVVNISVVIII
jgi:hypothetical protein